MLAIRSGSVLLSLQARGVCALAIALFIAGCSGAPAEENGAPAGESSESGSSVPAQADAADGIQTVKTATLHLVFEDAVLRSPLPGADKTAGYVTVRNVGTSDVVLIGAEAETLGSIELHTMIHDGEMMRMRRIDEVEVPAGESVAFERGGKHLMIFGLEDMADSSEIVFLTANDEHLPVRFATIAVTEG